MITREIVSSNTREEVEKFRTGDVATIVGGHFVNDAYTAFLPTLLPLLIEKLTLSLTQAGSLTAILQLPSLLNPFIGYLAGRMSLRYFVILAPAFTATFMSLLGFAPNYLFLVILLFACGLAVAAFHAPAPAMVGAISGRQVGKGMSFFMAAGELGRTLGPIAAVWSVSLLGFDGFYQVMIAGWAASLFLYIRLRDVPARVAHQSGLVKMFPAARRLFIPLSLTVILRAFLVVSISIYLPTLMNQEGAALWVAGGALAITQAAGVAGALVSGPASDRWGRRMILTVSLVGSAAAMLLFLQSAGWLLAVLLIALGFLTLSAQPVLMAIVQDQFPEHRAVANGIFMAVTFTASSLGVLAIGKIGDIWGLRPAFLVSAALSLLAVAPLYWLPEGEGAKQR